MFPLNYIVDVGAQRCEDPKLLIPAITFEVTQPIRPRYINVTDGHMDDLRQQYRTLHYVHRAVKTHTQNTLRDCCITTKFNDTNLSYNK